MTGKLMFVPDTHVVVPKEFIESYVNRSAIEVLNASPQLTTPPVLRWEKDLTRGYIWELWFYDAVIAVAHNQGWDSMYAGSSMIKNNPEHARRAAEAALGLPIVEEV